MILSTKLWHLASMPGGNEIFSWSSGVLYIMKGISVDILRNRRSQMLPTFTIHEKNLDLVINNCRLYNIRAWNLCAEFTKIWLLGRVPEEFPLFSVRCKPIRSCHFLNRMASTTLGIWRCISVVGNKAQQWILHKLNREDAHSAIKGSVFLYFIKVFKRPSQGGFE